VAAPTPIRPAEEVVGAFVPITLGGKDFSLRELPRRANREWQAHLTSELRKAMAASSPLDTADQVIQAIADSSELMMDLLISYDIAGKAWEGHKPVLPDREWIDTKASDRECYEAIKKVTGAAYPFGADILRLLPELRPAILDAISRGVAASQVAMMRSWASTSSSPPSTVGDPSTSKPKSRTRSSSRSSTKPSSASGSSPSSTSID